MARVGVTNMESYIRGITTLHHYERISSQDLGLKGTPDIRNGGGPRVPRWLHGRNDVTTSLSGI